MSKHLSPPMPKTNLDQSLNPVPKDVQVNHRVADGTQSSVETLFRPKPSRKNHQRIQILRTCPKTNKIQKQKRRPAALKKLAEKVFFGNYEQVEERTVAIYGTAVSRNHKTSAKLSCTNTTSPVGISIDGPIPSTDAANTDVQ